MGARRYVTVVSGMPRSGTSLAMQLLVAGGLPARSDGVRTPDAANRRGYLEHAAVRRLGRDPAADAVVAGAVGRAIKVVHALAAGLPRGLAYRVLWMERPVGEVVASQLAMLRRAGVPDDGLPAERAAAVLAAEADAARAALEARPDCRVLRVDTDALVADPAAGCARIAAFLDDLDVAAMVRRVTPSLYRSGLSTPGYTAAMPVAEVAQLGPLRLEVEHRAPGPEGGPTLHVRRAADGREVLRFDAFARGGHWHLDPDGRDEITRLGPEVESLDWTVDALRHRLSDLVAHAGMREPLPAPEEALPVLARVEAALRNPPPEFDALREPVLRQRSGEKWHLYPDDVLALWVADMDFEVAEPVRRRLQRALDVGDFGYPLHPAPTPLPELFAARAAQRYGWQVDPRRVELLSEVVQGIWVALSQFTGEGDGVIVPTPVYPPFLGAVKGLGRTLVESPMREGPDGYEVDLEDLRAKAGSARVLLLCNPQNPTGRALRREELLGIAAIAEEHDLLVVSDEIHADLVLPGARHLPFASLSPEAEGRCITLTAASKAFNIAGLRCAVAVFGSAELKRGFCGFPRHLRGGLGGPGLLATEAAWRHADPWLDDLLPYLEANRDFVAEFVRAELPGVRHHPPEATYLAWLDCRALDLQPSPYRFFLERAKVGLSDGASFGSPGQGFVRLNFATSRALLEEALGRMAKALR